MPIGTKLNSILSAMKNEIKINVLFPVLGTTGKLVHFTGVITDVGDDYVEVRSDPKSGEFYYIPLSSLTAVTNEDPPAI
jgi:hypothetical protein